MIHIIDQREISSCHASTSCRSASHLISPASVSRRGWSLACVLPSSPWVDRLPCWKRSAWWRKKRRRCWRAKPLRGWRLRPVAAGRPSPKRRSRHIAVAYRKIVGGSHTSCKRVRGLLLLHPLRCYSAIALAAGGSVKNSACVLLHLLRQLLAHSGHADIRYLSAFGSKADSPLCPLHPRKRTS